MSNKYVFNPFTMKPDIVPDVSGFVSGPASTTDNAITRFDGTTGKLVQNSGVTVDDSNNMAGATNLSAVSATLSGLTASRALQTDASKNLQSSTVTTTELGFVSGVTSAIQTQLNGKQATGNYITALTGDVTATGPGSVAATLATVNGNVGSFGTATQVGSFTVNAKGLITAASNTSIAITSAAITDFAEAAQDAVGGAFDASLTYNDGTNTISRSALTGDVTASLGSNATTISADAVDNTKLANMVQSTIKGRAAGAGTGDPTDLTATQATAILNTFTSTLQGLVPASGGGTTNFLRADGTFAAPTTSNVPTRVTTSTNYSVTNADDEIYVTTTATITLLLANASGAKPVTIINAGSGVVVTVNCSGGDTCNGETSQSLNSQYDNATFFPDATSQYYVK